MRASYTFHTIVSIIFFLKRRVRVALFEVNIGSSMTITTLLEARHYRRDMQCHAQRKICLKKSFAGTVVSLHNYTLHAKSIEVRY